MGTLLKENFVRKNVMMALQTLSQKFVSSKKNVLSDIMGNFLNMNAGNSVILTLFGMRVIFVWKNAQLLQIFLRTYMKTYLLIPALIPAFLATTPIT